MSEKVNGPAPVEKDPFVKTVVLPMSKKTVVMTAPLWKKRREVKAMCKDLDYDEEESSMSLMAASSVVDGVQLRTHEDFDDWPMTDVMFLFDQFNDWEKKAGPNGKN